MHMSSVFPRPKLHHNELQLPLPLPCCPRKTNVSDLSDLIQFVKLNMSQRKYFYYCASSKTTVLEYTINISDIVTI